MATQIKQSYAPMWKPKREFPKRFPSGFPHGPRTIKRQEQNKILNVRLPEIKKRCELNVSPHCTKVFSLSLAHSKKSRFITTDKDWQEAARSCLACHDVADSMSHAEMKRLILEAIAKRKPSLLCVVKKREKQTLPNG